MAENIGQSRLLIDATERGCFDERAGSGYGWGERRSGGAATRPQSACEALVPYMARSALVLIGSYRRFNIFRVQTRTPVDITCVRSLRKVFDDEPRMPQLLRSGVTKDGSVPHRFSRPPMPSAVWLPRPPSRQTA